MSHSESRILSEIQLAASRLGARLWRNQTGKYQLTDGRWLSSGLCVGSSDLIGIAPDGRFLAVEVKRPGKQPTPEQRAFIAFVRSFGGIAGVCHSVDEFIELMASS